MTTPNHLTPDGSITGYGSWPTVQARTRSEWEASEYDKWAGAMAGIPKIGDKLEQIPIIGGALSDFWEIITGIPDSNENDAGSFIRGFINSFLAGLTGGSRPSQFTEVYDGMKELKDAKELLDGVRGYGQCYMSVNPTTINAANNVIRAPFNAQLGPLKDVTIDPDGGLILGSEGLWTISAVTRARATLFTGNGHVRMFLSVRKPDGSIYSELGIDNEEHGRGMSLVGTGAFVVPAPGYQVRVYLYSNAWRYFEGGTLFSRLSAVKHDNRTNNPGSDTVPDQPDPRG
ncbi:hypothetical protein SEA_SWEATNTEARS_27 [Gordonia phage SweatNTears]|nr:hypothetical protein SEA_SWEATNTEARS_27 [Gordonia phage SweatNTears]